MKDLPSIRNLKKTSLRAAVALSLRAVQRVTPLLRDIPDPAEITPRVSDERVFKIELLLVASFCNGTLHGDSTRLSEIMEDGKWDQKVETTTEFADPVLRSGNHVFSAAMDAQFSTFTASLIPTFLTANNVIKKVHRSLIVAYEASVRAGAAHSSRFIIETVEDFEWLYARNTALFPELGPPIDTSITGPLGDLWSGNTPPMTPSVDCTNSQKEHLVSANGESSEESDKNFSNKKARNAPSNGYSPMHGAIPASPEEGYLYKYISFKTLLKVLENPALRFSPLSAFNDPFDGQLLPIQRFGSKEFRSALRDETARLVFAEDEPVYQDAENIPTESVLSAVAQRARELLEGDGSISFVPEGYPGPGEISSLSSLLKPMIFMAQRGTLGPKFKAAATLNDLLDLFNRVRISFSVQGRDRRVIDALATTVRALCLSEVPDSLLMWSHYADHHVGAVLKFDARSETADYFAGARPVNYAKKLPSFSDPLSLVRRFLGLQVEDAEKYLSRQLFTKSVEWAYEKEWRVLATIEMQEHGDFVPFQIDSLTAIYLGCGATTPNVRSVMDLVLEKQYPTDVYIAVKDDADFALSFVPLSNGRTRASDIPIMDVNERARRYRWCLDAYFDFWNDPEDDLYGELRQLRCEGFLADFAPPSSIGLFREMILKLQETYAANPITSADREKEPEEYEKQYLEILRPSAKAYGAIEDLLLEDLTRRGGTLPERTEGTEF